MKGNKKVGLSLSGGGYRAAAFHLGTMKKLHEMGALEDVDVISTISGGSIIGGYYCTHDGDFDSFKESLIEKLTTVDIIKHILRSWVFIRFVLLIVLFLGAAIAVHSTPYHHLSLVIVAILIFILAKYQFAIFPVSDVIEAAYEKYFFKDKKLPDLKDSPTLVVGSTNLQTSSPFSFTKDRMWDYDYSYMKPSIRFDETNFPLSKAVMASSSVPGAFSPIKIDTPFFKDPSDAGRVSPTLVDGGVYDNQGIHYITRRGGRYSCDIVITSDAQNNLPFDKAYNNIFAVLFRTVAVFMIRIKNFQMMENLYFHALDANRQIAYLSLAWEIERCIEGFADNLEKGSVTEECLRLHGLKEEWVADPKKYRSEIIAHMEECADYKKILANQLTEEELKIAQSVPINLKALKREQIDCLMKHAENLTELLVKLYCPIYFKLKYGS